MSTAAMTAGDATVEDVLDNRDLRDRGLKSVKTMVMPLTVTGMWRAVDLSTLRSFGGLDE